ncbi:hypothetical protein DID74_01625 [Candidatus Marinamargulisbacteria bacterium SCGC AG-333-B06]|nr:hypothetical protein DID74_01625 [Candidatus Marinamargulisbacteria bacterium SCGC AG-333-B06]
MSLSIIIACYNDQQTLKPIIKLIRSQHPNSELIVIDDGLIDGSKEWLTEHSSTFNFILV